MVEVVMLEMYSKHGEGVFLYPPGNINHNWGYIFNNEKEIRKKIEGWIKEVGWRDIRAFEESDPVMACLSYTTGKIGDLKFFIILGWNSILNWDRLFQECPPPFPTACERVPHHHLLALCGLPDVEVHYNKIKNLSKLEGGKK